VWKVPLAFRDWYSGSKSAPSHNRHSGMTKLEKIIPSSASYELDVTSNIGPSRSVLIAHARDNVNSVSWTRFLVNDVRMEISR
jgi:hypothetical protein